MDEEMEMRVLWSVGLLHPHLKAPGYLIDGLYVCDSQITMTSLLQLSVCSIKNVTFLSLYDPLSS